MLVSQNSQNTGLNAPEIFSSELMLGRPSRLKSPKMLSDLFLAGL